MAAYNKFEQFVEDIAVGVHTSDTDQFTVALCAAANAPVAANSVLLDLVPIAYTNLGSRTLTTSTAAQTAGVYTQLFADLILLAGGGAVAGFRYIVIYNDTPVAPADPLVAWYDYTSDLVLNDTESLTVDFTTSTYTIT